MVIGLTTQQHFREVKELPFCYLCSKRFTEANDRNDDHVPPKALFDKNDREPLILCTHKDCNNARKLTDERMGQLIGLIRGYAPSDPRDRHLKFRLFDGASSAAVTNVDVDNEVWRWVHGFHAALYGVPLVNSRGTLGTPLIKATTSSDGLKFTPLYEQHKRFVETTKANRFRQNLDRIECNKGKLVYECVWARAQNEGRPWIGVFALDVDGWKAMGDPRFPRRGCAGAYMLPDGGVPEGAARDNPSPVLLPNLDPLDPFGQ
jgi:hypothetical protein